MRRLAHDLTGTTQRISRLADSLEEELQQTQQVWRDRRGASFLQENFAHYKPNIGQLVATLTESTELFEQIVKKLSDPEQVI
jgi:uncharacterized protein YukE